MSWHNLETELEDSRRVANLATRACVVEDLIAYILF